MSIKISDTTLKSLLNDILNSLENREEANDDLLEIGKENFKGGYGAIALAIQEKYVMIPKSELEALKKIA